MAENIDNPKQDQGHPPSHVGQNRRKNRKFLISPRQQVSYAFYFMFIGIFGMTFIFISYLRVSRRIVASLAFENPGLIGNIDQLESFFNSAIWLSIGFAAVMVGFGVLISIAITHRVFGPIVQINRVIEELKKGNYSVRGKLRAKDEFQEVMNDLNELATTLESRHR